MQKTIRLEEKFAQFDECWKPHVVGELNGQQVKLAKLQGEFVWHRHDDEDELFYVVSGELELHFRDRIERVGEKELCIVPRGVEHKPIAKELCHVMLFEPASTLNTGNVRNERTVDDLRHL